MINDRRTEKALATPRNPQLDAGAARNLRETKPFVVSAYGLERRAGWAVRRGAGRPIDLERRARFARFDGV
ncbi:MAG: hypothetical protein ACR652_12705 [Methylocystis sp.]|uniref:hypothetical protein n=1 Tax=Methylocystis sp. TaxID=1911079 RepID=UPI003DA57401